MTEEQMVKVLLSVLKRDSLPTIIGSQIKKFRAQGITPKQIARAVVYYYEERGGDTSKVDIYGIGIVPLVYKEADAFYENLSQQQEIAKKDAERKKQALMNIPVVKVRPQKRNFVKKGYDLNE